MPILLQLALTVVTPLFPLYQRALLGSIIR